MVLPENLNQLRKANRRIDWLYEFDMDQGFAFGLISLKIYN